MLDATLKPLSYRVHAFGHDAARRSSGAAPQRFCAPRSTTPAAMEGRLMDLVTWATGGVEDLSDATPALWALVPDVPDPASMVLLVLALATAAGPTVPAEARHLVQDRYRQLTEPGAPDGPRQ